MKTQIKMTLIASAVAALVSVPAMASENDHHDHHGNGDHQPQQLYTNAQAGANAIDVQNIGGNTVSNNALKNDAYLGDKVGSGASGNIGMNVAAGDTNVQDNAAALASVDASFVFGQSGANVAVSQVNGGNTTMNHGVQNNAMIDNSAFSNASGNIGVNVAAGTGNAQKNTMAASVSTARVANASVNSNQQSAGNSIRNEGYVKSYTDTTQVSLSGSGYYFGGGTIQGGHDEHHGHDRHSSSRGTGFTEAGLICLDNITGSVNTTRYVVVSARNDATLGGSAFTNASGNIGVNVASGTGNLQSNSLSMAVSCVTCGGTPQ